jgi:hypothetical protein
MNQYLISGISLLVFAAAALGWWIGRREVRDTRVILTDESEVAALSRRTRRAL